MNHFETVHQTPGEDFLTVTSHNTLEEAIEYADTHNTTTIYEIGGGWNELCKCDFCKEWIPAYEMTEDLCNDCTRAIEEHAAEELKHRESKRKDYRICKIGWSYEVQYYGMQVLDGWAERGWKTIATFQDESEAQRYIDFACKCLPRG